MNYDSFKVRIVVEGLIARALNETDEEFLDYVMDEGFFENCCEFEVMSAEIIGKEE